MIPNATEQNFEQLSWHDNIVYGWRFDVGDSFRDEWHSNLILDIDHIVEWVCDADGRYRFRVAPASLSFHDVTDLRLAVDWGDSGHQTNLLELSIDVITRTQVADQKICLDRPYYRWHIAFNWPKGGEISLGASGFTQQLLVAPMLLDEQRLSPADRRKIAAAV